MARLYKSKDDEEEKKRQQEAEEASASAPKAPVSSGAADMVQYLKNVPESKKQWKNDTAAEAAPATAAAQPPAAKPDITEEHKPPKFGEVKTGKNTYDFSWADGWSDQQRMMARVDMAHDPGMLEAYDKYITSKGYVQDYQREEKEWEVLGRLKNRGLVTYTGQQYDLLHTDFSGLLNAVRMIPDTNTRKAAYSDLKKLTKVKGGRFEEYTLSGTDPGYMDTADMPEKDYNKFLDSLSAQFYRSGGHEKENAEAYLKKYDEINGELSGLTAVQKHWYKQALDEAYYAQTGMHPDVYNARKLAEGDKPEKKVSKQEDKPGLFERIGDALEDLAEWGKEKLGIDEEPKLPEQTPTPAGTPAPDTVKAEADVVSTPAPADPHGPIYQQPKPGPAPTVDMKIAERAAEKAAEEIELAEETAPAEVQGPAYQAQPFVPEMTIDQRIAERAGKKQDTPEAAEVQGPVQQKQEPEKLTIDQQMAMRAAKKPEAPAQEKTASGSVNLSDDISSAIEYARMGHYELLDTKTQEELQRFYDEAGPGTRIALGELAPELYKEYQTGNTPADYLYLQNTGLLGSTLAQYALQIRGEDFPDELYGDAVMELARITTAAENDPTITPEDLLLDNRYELYLRNHPDELAGLVNVFDQLAGMRADAEANDAKLQDMKAKELENARYAVSIGQASAEQKAVVLEHAPQMDSVMAYRDPTYAEMAQELNYWFMDSSGNWGEDIGGWFNSTVYQMMHARGVKDLEDSESEYEFLLNGTMEHLLMQDMRMASAVGQDLATYYKKQGGMNLELLAQRASADILRMGEETSEDEIAQVSQNVADEAEKVGLGVKNTVELTVLSGAGQVKEGALETVIMVASATDTPRDVARITTDFNKLYGPFYGPTACAKQQRALAESGKLPEELSKSILEYLDNGGDPYQLGIHPEDLGGTINAYAETQDRLEYYQQMVSAYATEGEEKFFELGSGTVYNGILMTAAAIGSAALAPVAGSAAPFLAMRGTYGVVSQGSYMQNFMSKGYTLKESLALSEAQVSAEALANMVSLGNLTSQLSGYSAWLNKGITKLGGTKNPSVVRTFFESAKRFGKPLVKDLAEEVIKDPILEGTLGAAATSAVASVIEDKREGKAINLGTAARAAVIGTFAGVESVPGTIEAMIEDAPNAFVASLPIALLGAGGEYITSSRSYKAAQDLMNHPNQENAEKFSTALAEDAQDDHWVEAVKAEEKQAEVEQTAAANLVFSPDKLLYNKAQKTREQANSHKATLEASTAANQQAVDTIVEMQEKLDAGDVDPQTVVDLNEAQEAFAKSRHNIDESTREYTQKSTEARQAEHDLVQDAHNKAVLEVGQKHAAAKEAAQVAADVSQYETMTGDDTIRRVNLDENMRTTGFANRREEFAEAIDSWDGEQKGLEFVVGRVGEPLKGLGVQDAEIVLASDKLAQIKKKHPAMSDDVIRQLPDVVEKPVVVMRSRTVDNRLTMFGNVKDEAGDPVLAVISIDPQQNVVAGANFIRLNSAYGKDKLPQEFINRSEVLYVDKNRAADWAVSTRLQLPVDLTPVRDSSANIVPQAQKNDKPEIDAMAEVSSSGASAGSGKRQRKAEGSAMSAVQKLADSIGVGYRVRSGQHFRSADAKVGKNVKGYYKNGQRNIIVRSSDAGRVSVSGHEVGHAIQEQLGLASNEQMIESWKNSFGNTEAYTPDQYNHEAFAEFFWRYLCDRDWAEEYAGEDFVETFEYALRQKKMLNDVKRTQARVSAFMHSSMEEKIRARMVNAAEANKRSDTSFARRVEIALVDDTAAAEDMQDVIRARTGEKHLSLNDNLRDTIRFNRQARGRAAHCLNVAMVDKNGTVVHKSLQDAFRDAGVKGKDFDLFWEYMLAAHSLDRDTEKRAKNQVFDEESMPTAERRAFVKQIEQEHPEFVKGNDEFQKWRRKFLETYLADNMLLGLKSWEFLDALDEAYPHYVPTYRAKSGAKARNATVGGRNFKIRTATGSTEDIIHPFDSFVGMVNSIAQTVASEDSKHKFAQLYDRYKSPEPGKVGAGMGLFANELTQDMMRVSTSTEDIREKVTQMLDQIGTDPEVILQIGDIIGDEKVEYHGTGRVNMDNVITVHDGLGNKRYFEIYNPELYELLSGSQMSGEKDVTDLFAKVTRTMSMLTTGSNPVFSLTNAIRDYQNSVNYGSWASSYIDGSVKWLSALKDAFFGTEIAKEYEALGGGGWTQFDTKTKKSTEQVRGEVFKGYRGSSAGRFAKTIGRTVWEVATLEKINSAVEEASRLAEYKYGKHDRSTPQGRIEAFLAAQDVSTDFSRKGNHRLARNMKSLVPFFNASVQGVYRNARQLTAQESDRAATRFTKTVVNTTLASLIANALLLKYLDDDEQEEYFYLSDDLKAKHMFLPNFAPEVFGNAPLIRIPLDQNPVMYAINAAVSNFAWHGKMDNEFIVELGAVAQAIVDNLNPVGSTILDPALSVMSNKNWYGSNIVPTYLQSYDAPDQYSEETPKFFVGTADVLDGLGVKISPMMLQYLAEQYTGFIGQTLIPALPSETTEGNVLANALKAYLATARKRLTSDPLKSNDVVSTVYDNFDTLTAIQKAGRSKREMDVNLLNPNLSDWDVKMAAEIAYDMTHSGGDIYEAKKEISAAYDTIEEIEAREDLTDVQKKRLTDDVRREMIETALDAKESMENYRALYMDSGLIPRFLRKIFLEKE